MQNQDAKIAKLMDMLERISENSPNMPKQQFKMHDEVKTSSKSEEKDVSKSHLMKENSLS